MPRSKDILIVDENRYDEIKDPKTCLNPFELPKEKWIYDNYVASFKKSDVPFYTSKKGNKLYFYRDLVKIKPYVKRNDAAI